MVIELNEDLICLVGDTHSIPVFNRVLDSLPVGVTILHMGDIGISAGSRRDLEKLSRHAVKRKQLILGIRGNHDNPNAFPNKLPNVHLIEDYTELRFKCGAIALCVGGGISLNRTDCIEGVDYWSGEITEFKPDLCKKVDFLFLHDAPSYFNEQTEGIKTNYFAKFVAVDPTLVDDCTKQRDVIDKITEQCKPSLIFSGHFHNSRYETLNGVQYRCLNINEVLSFDAERYFTKPTL